MEAIFRHLMQGFEVAIMPVNILWVFIGGLLGTIIGMLPGLGPATGVAILIPITYNMNPATALITMCAVYYGAMFGGSRASIMINTPGDASAIVSCFDGYPMTKNGRAGEALAISATPPLSAASSDDLPRLSDRTCGRDGAEVRPRREVLPHAVRADGHGYPFRGKPPQGLHRHGLRFMLSTIGIDGQSGAIRFTYGLEALQDGIDFLVAMIGLYAVAEVFKNYRSLNVK